jgi:hypothetical protein
MTANLTGVSWNLSVILICISFMAKDGEHFPMCLSAICISSNEEIQFVWQFINWIIFSFAV